MKTSLRNLLIASVLGFVALGASASAQADHRPYWNSYWGWYDQTYAPYQSYYYSNAPGPVYPLTNGYYNSSPYVNGYHSAPYSGGYISAPMPGGVRPSNRITFGWW